MEAQRRPDASAACCIAATAIGIVLLLLLPQQVPGRWGSLTLNLASSRGEGHSDDNSKHALSDLLRWVMPRRTGASIMSPSLGMAGACPMTALGFCRTKRTPQEPNLQVKNHRL